MQNNWVLLQGRLCHTPNYSSTKKGLHKVAFRLAVPRPPRSPAGTPPPPPLQETDSQSSTIQLSSPDSDYVTVILIGKPAWEFKQLDLQAGAAVRVQGRLRSWDIPPEQNSSPFDMGEVLEKSPNQIHVSRRDYRLEVIAEKVEPLDNSAR